MRRLFRAVRIAIFSGALLLQGALSALPVYAQAVNENAPRFPCFLKSECLQGETATGKCSTNFCFEAGIGGCASPQGLCFANPPPIDLTVRIGGALQVKNIGDYVKVVYQYGVSIAGLVAAVLAVIGGFQYMTGKAKEGKELIYRSLLGIVLVLGAYVILATINPALVNLELPRVPIVKKQTIASCAQTELCHPCGVPYYALKKRGEAESTGESSADPCLLSALVSANSDSLQSQFEVIGECVGKGCGADTMKGGGSSCSDATFRCKSVQSSEDTTFACGVKPDEAIEGYACKRCKAEGAGCGRTGANDECCGGFCSDTATGNFCASGKPGDDCDDDNECISGICQENWGNSCSSGAVGAPCADSTECTNGNKCSTTGSNVCTPATQYSYCDDDSECKSNHCLMLTGYENVCMPAGVESLVTCNTNADCAGKGGYCNTEALNFCTNGSPGSPCADNSECANKLCDLDNDMCVTGENGGSCTDGNDCLSKQCFGGGDYSVCVSGLKGSKCGGQAKCVGAGLTCASGRCVAK
jgi:hypothetical protein